MVKRAEEERQENLTKKTDGKMSHSLPRRSSMHHCLILDTGAPTGSVDSTGAEVRSVTGDRTTVHSAGQRTESLGDKSETGLKRVAEKMINYDMTPVAQALARHLGIDLTTDGVQARNRRGISMIVHGPPGSGTPTFARRIVRHALFVRRKINGRS